VKTGASSPMHRGRQVPFGSDLDGLEQPKWLRQGAG
jgi:hypothetical protein